MITEEMKSKARTMAVMLRIGKSGLTKGMLDEIRSQIKKKKLVKIKMLKSSLGGMSPSVIATEIVHTTNSELVSLVGNTIVIYKKS